MKRIGSLTCALLLTLQFSQVQAASIVAAERAIQQSAFDKALEELRPLAKDGDPEALYLLGTLYRDGKGVERDTEQATNYFNSASRQGHIGSVNALREMKNEVYKKEFDQLLPDAESGVARAQNRIGEMYEFAQGVPRDLQQAFNWYTKAATSDYLPAIHNLARSYNFGTGTAVNFEKAESLFRQAAAQGYAESMFFLGTMYATHNGADKNIDPDVLAYAWMACAAERGSQTANTIAGRFKMKLEGGKLTEAETLANSYRERFVTPFQ